MQTTMGKDVKKQALGIRGILLTGFPGRFWAIGKKKGPNLTDPMREMVVSKEKQNMRWKWLIPKGGKTRMGPFFQPPQTGLG